MNKYGDAGRFRIPLLVIDTPLYKSNHDAQKVVDNRNSAVWLKWPKFYTIADHCDQEGMWRLRWAIPKVTKLYLEQQSETTEYVCFKKQKGIIHNNKMYDSKKRNIMELDGIDLCVYTCTGRMPQGDTEVWLTYWKKQSGNK